MASASTAPVKQRIPGVDRLTRPYIDGKFVDSLSGKTFQSISPISQEVLCDVQAGDAADIDRAVRSARAAFETGDWPKMTPRARKQILVELARKIRAGQDDLALLMTADMGKPITASRWEVEFSALVIEWFAEAVDHLYGEVAPLGNAAHGTLTREPVGVVGAITPWNFPVLMQAVKMGPALASGNSLIIKPAEQAPLAVLALAELATEAGVPDGVLNVVPGLGEEAGKPLALHMDVDAIGFTGSTEVGRLIMTYAAQSNLKKVTLELGGKSPAVVLSDVADPHTVGVHTAASIFGNAGQMCDATSRLIVHQSVVDRVVESLSAEGDNWRPGDPFDPATTMGTIVDSSQFHRVMGYLDTAREEGARVASGGGQVMADTGGLYVEPTVLADVTTTMRVAREELFGPIASVITVSSDEEALRVANDTEYGLAASVWTRDIVKAHRFARSLRAGNVMVNCDELFDVTLAHGGYKQSGFGRDYSHHAFDNYTHLKTTYINLALDANPGLWDL